MSLCETGTVEIQKHKTMQRYLRFNKVASLATTLQFCFAFLLFFWLISRTSAYFDPRRMCTIAVNHHFGFLIGNLIIITLVVKSGHSACNSRKPSESDDDDDNGFRIRRFPPPDLTVSSEIAAVKDIEKVAVPSPVEIEVLAVQSTEADPPKVYRRTRSEEFDRKETEKIQLRRSETEPRREMQSEGQEEATGKRRTLKVEDLSNEEFQSKVEAFIQRQQRFLREESLINST